MKNFLKNTEVQNWFKKQSNKLILVAFAVITLLVFCAQNHSSSIVKIENHEAESTDTVIPRGYVLVPIELQNADSMSSLIGAYGVVDLFTAGKYGQKSGVKVGSRLKLVRAPLNPNQFAVLVPEAESSAILANTGPFFATIQNPNQSQNSKVILKQKKSSRIEYL